MTKINNKTNKINWILSKKMKTRAQINNYCCLSREHQFNLSHNDKEQAL